MPNIFNAHKKDDNERWGQTLWREELLGECQKCKHRKGLWTIYADNTELLRCLNVNCRSTEHFLIDPRSFNDGSKWPPFKSDSDVEEIKSAWDSRFTRGTRW